MMRARAAGTDVGGMVPRGGRACQSSSSTAHIHGSPNARRPARAKTRDGHLGINGKIGLALTTAVGTMWCAYAFALLALLVVPQALDGGLLTFIPWVSQTFIQLVMLSVIMVGQNILGRVSDKRADETYQDAEATLHEAQQIQDHLKAQDDAIGTLLDKIARLEAARGHA
jgi:hypothetical protein